jgi:Fuc2NAc and GlcNAc transferase
MGAAGLGAGGAERNWCMVYSTTETITFVAAALASWLIAGAVIKRSSRLGRMDIPNTRSSHTVPTPRGGGIGIVFGVIGFALMLAFNQRETWALLATSVLIAAIGWLDDRYTLSAKRRMLGYLLLSIALVISILWSMSFSLVETGLLGLFFTLYLVWISNLTNFMDGVDGIAASHLVVASLSSAFLLIAVDAPKWASAFFILLSAASFGFLLRNWSPARVFMGDVGSVFIGYFFSGLVTLATFGVSPEVAFRTFVGLNLVYGTFTIDATVTLIVRLLTGQRISQAHRSHCYQILVHRHRWTHAKVSTAYCLVSVFWLSPWAWVIFKNILFPTIVAAAFAVLPLIFICIFVGSGRLVDSPK